MGGTPLVLAPTEGSASSLEPVCALSPNRPQPRPLWLQELALPCNVLILIKVQTGFYFGGGGGGAQVWDEKGTALPHPYCMPPFLLLFPPSTEDNALYRYHPHISHWGRAPSISPRERLPEDHPEPKMSFLRQRLKPSEQVDAVVGPRGLTRGSSRRPAAQARSRCRTCFRICTMAGR